MPNVRAQVSIALSSDATRARRPKSFTPSVAEQPISAALIQGTEHGRSTASVSAGHPSTRPRATLWRVGRLHISEEGHIVVYHDVDDNGTGDGVQRAAIA